MNGNTAQKAVIITGAARRIGRQLALTFAEAGYDVALHYHHSQADAQQTKIDIERLGRRCELFKHDLTDIAGIPALMARIYAALPQAGVLINNASVFERADFMATDEALFDRQFTANFKAPFFLTQAFARHAAQGSVINLLDTMIAQTQGTHFAYLLAKKALADFTRMAARALGPQLRVNGICPGSVLPSNQNDAAYEEKIRPRLPLQAHPQPDDVAAAALWLATQHSITGQLLYVDGGHHVL